MSLAAIIDAMIASGCTGEQIGSAVKAVEAEREREIAERRAKAAEKKRRQRAKVCVSSSSVPDCPGDIEGQVGTEGDPEQKEMLPTPLERKTPPPPKENPPKGGQKKGSRLPADWQPSGDDFAYGRALGLTDQQIFGFAEDMRLWAASAAGQKGVKLDWPSTFKGWMRREAQKSRASPRRPNGSLMAEIAGGSLRGSTDEQYPGEYQSSPSPRTAKPTLFGFDSDVPEPIGDDSGGALLDLRAADARWY